jgi:hypothetical protein
MSWSTSAPGIVTTIAAYTRDSAALTPRKSPLKSSPTLRMRRESSLNR